MTEKEINNVENWVLAGISFLSLFVVGVLVLYLKEFHEATESRLAELEGRGDAIAFMLVEDQEARARFEQLQAELATLVVKAKNHPPTPEGLTPEEQVPEAGRVVVD